LAKTWLADPPQPNRPIIFNPDGPVAGDTEGEVQTGTSTPVTVPPVKTGELTSKSGNVVVTSLVPKQELANPFVILGRALAFESVVSWRVTDGRGNVIAKGTVLTDAPDVGRYGQFRVRAFYDRAPATPDGTVQVYTVSPRDGSELDIVRVSVKLVTETVPLKAFFLDVKEDPTLLHCDRPAPRTRRVPKTANAAEAALRELLRGPTAAEEDDGARTAILPGTELRSVTINGENATVDFNRQFALGIAGSCNVQALRSQVEETMKQFVNVKNVTILVEGADASQVLQP
jgi:hypothetical protein